MASGDTLCIFTALNNEPPASAYATLDVRNAHLVLDFDKDTDESAVFRGVLPAQYSGGGLTIKLHFGGTGITTGDVRWDAAIEALSAQDKDSDGFAAVQSATVTVAATDGTEVIGTITMTAGAQMDSLAAGEEFRLKITRDANHVADTADADAELSSVEIRET